MGRVAGVNHGRFDVDRKIHLKSELTEVQVGILKSRGFREVRDPGFSQGRGTAYMVYNQTGETNRHYILWNLIFDEAKKYTPNVEYHLTKFPDVVFQLDALKWIAVEVEATRKTEKQLEAKLAHLNERYEGWFFVVTDYDLLEHYRQFGPTVSRKHVRGLIEGYFEWIKDQNQKQSPNQAQFGKQAN